MLRLWFVLAVNYVHVQPSLLEEQRYKTIRYQCYHQENACQIETEYNFKKYNCSNI